MNDRSGLDHGAVFDRDAHTCQRCGERYGPQRRTELWAYSLAAAERDDPPDETLVTVCEACRDRLEGVRPAWLRTEAPVGERVVGLLREVTSVQGAAVGDVADVAASASRGVDDSDGRATYTARRRAARLALAFVDRCLEAAVELDDSELDDDAADALADVCELAGDLQADLRRVLELSDVAVAASGRCHACLEPVDASNRCGACASPILSTDEWSADDGTVTVGPLYGAVNDRLQDASRTTERLAARSTRLAESLLETRRE